MAGLRGGQANVSNEFCEIEKFAQGLEQLAFDFGFLLGDPQVSSSPRSRSRVRASGRSAALSTGGHATPEPGGFPAGFA